MVFEDRVGSALNQPAAGAFGLHGATESCPGIEEPHGPAELREFVRRGESGRAASENSNGFMIWFGHKLGFVFAGGNGEAMLRSLYFLLFSCSSA